MYESLSLQPPRWVIGISVPPPKHIKSINSNRNSQPNFIRNSKVSLQDSKKPQKSFISSANLNFRKSQILENHNSNRLLLSSYNFLYPATKIRLRKHKIRKVISITSRIGRALSITSSEGHGGDLPPSPIHRSRILINIPLPNKHDRRTAPWKVMAMREK